MFNKTTASFTSMQASSSSAELLTTASPFESLAEITFIGLLLAKHWEMGEFKIKKCTLTRLARRPELQFSKEYKTEGNKIERVLLSI